MATKTHITKTEEGQVEKAVQIRANDPGAPVANQTWINTTDKKMKFYDGSDIQNVGAAGVGSAATFALFQAEDGDISSFTNMTVETGAPIAGAQSYAVSAFPASCPDVTVDERRAGRSCLVSFVQKLASGSYKAKVVDNSSNVLQEITIDTDSAQKVVMKFGIPSAATSVKLELEDVSSATTVIVDDIEFSDDISRVGSQLERQSDRYDGYAGKGSTNDRIPYYTNAVSSNGSGLYTIENDSTNGFSITFLRDCKVDITGSMPVQSSNGFGEMGFSLNSSELTTNINAIADADRLIIERYSANTATTDVVSPSWSGQVQAGDVIRPHMSNFTPEASVIDLAHLAISAEADNQSVVSTVDQVAPVRYTQSSGQSLPNSTDTIINFDEQDYDDQSHVTTGAGWKYTVPAKGKYRVSPNIVLDDSGAGQATQMSMRIKVNGSNVIQRDFPKMNSSSVRWPLDAQGVLDLDQGDEVQISVFHNYGSGFNVETQSISNAVFIEPQASSIDLATSPVQKVAFVKDVKANNVDGGSFNSGDWRTRDLNTVEGDTSIVSVASNQFTLGEGKYIIEAIGPAYAVGRHKLRLRNITAGSDAVIGDSVLNAATGEAQTNATLNGYVEISSSTVFEVQHQCENSTATDGFGVASNFSVDEVYTQVKITKLPI